MNVDSGLIELLHKNNIVLDNNELIHMQLAVIDNEEVLEYFIYCSLHF